MAEDPKDFVRRQRSLHRATLGMPVYVLPFSEVVEPTGLKFTRYFRVSDAEWDRLCNHYTLTEVDGNMCILDLNVDIVQRRLGRQLHIIDLGSPLPSVGESEKPKDFVRCAEAALLVEMLLDESPQFSTLKKGKLKLDAAEREEVMRRKAVWHHGPKGQESAAVWKSKVRGKMWYVTNTHRCFQVRPTLKGAIQAYHKVVKQTA